MNKAQAEEILDYIALEKGPQFAELWQLGNGEWVPVCKRPQWFCWSLQDWQRLRQLLVDKLAS